MLIDKPSVYLEPSFISMLASKPSLLVTTVNMQHWSRVWWETQRHKVRLVVSEVVYTEIAQGDTEAAEQRLQYIGGLTSLELTPNVIRLAKTLIAQQALPATAEDDALHVACAAFYSIDYVLTWNCKHIANDHKKATVARLIESSGFKSPILLTPQAYCLGDDA